MTSKSKLVFYILYTAGFLGAGIIGFFSNSYFAYDKFNSFWANALYIVCFATLFITAFVQELFSSRALPDVIINAAVFLGTLTFFLLIYFIGGICVFLSLLYSGILFSVTGVRFALRLRADPTEKPDFKVIAALGALLLVAMYSMMTVDFVSEIYFAWALIPAAVLFAVSFTVSYFLLKNVWGNIYPTKAKRVGNAICAASVLFVFCFLFSGSAIGICNCVFDGEPVRVQYTVIDKYVSSGKITTHELIIIIDGEERRIPVSAEEYFETDAGDTVLIDYYSGAFGFAYYSYHGKT